MIRAMRQVVATVISIRFALTARRDLLLEILALRHQLTVLARSNRRFRPSDRLLWLILRRMWPRWRDALVLVQPATVDRWHRDRFDRRWWRRARRPGRPRIDSQYRDLIGRLADENRLWGAPRIHGELLKLGLVVSERTVSRYLRGRPRRLSQSWRTFLANHLGQFACISPAPSYASSDDVVDAFAMTCRSSPSSDRLSASRQVALVDSRAGVRRTFSCFDFIENHPRDHAGMRRTSGRAPPRNGCLQPAHGGRGARRLVPVAPGQLQPLRVETHVGRRSQSARTSSYGESLRLVCGGHIRVVIRRRSE